MLPILIKGKMDTFRFYDFDTQVKNSSAEVKNAIVKDTLIKPNALAEYFTKRYKNKLTGGTRLRDSVANVIESNSQCDGLFIFTDEVSWNDQRNIDSLTNIIPPELHNKTFLFNVDPTQNTMFSKTDKVTRISGLDGKVMFLLNMLLDFVSFKNNLVKTYNEVKTNKLTK